MPVNSLNQLLADNNANYTVTTHSPAHTSQEVAERTHTHGANMGKVIALKVDGQFALLMLPSHYHVVCDALRDEVGAQRVEIASESEFRDKFSDCELGAIPPFGELWGMPLYISSDFDPDHNLTFNAGSWSEVITMPFKEFVKLANPVTTNVGAAPPGITPPKVAQRQPRDWLQ